MLRLDLIVPIVTLAFGKFYRSQTLGEEFVKVVYSWV